MDHSRIPRPIRSVRNPQHPGPRLGPVFMTPRAMSVPMPQLEVMYHQAEVSQIQTDISQLEQQLNNLELEIKNMSKSEQTTPKRKPEAVRPRRILPSVPKGTQTGNTGKVSELSSKNDKAHDQLSSTDISNQLQVKTPPLTSTPKAEAGEVSDKSSVKSDDKVKDANSEGKKLTGVKIKPATFDGSGNWLDYKAHFDVCAELNGWTEKEKGMYLAVSLRGQAQGVFGNIVSKSHDFTELVKALENRFAPPNQTELYRVQLRERKQKSAESLSELGQDIRRLTNLAYPTAPADLRETLAKEQFVDALVSSDMRLRIKQARPSNLNDAVRHAVELEAFNRAERRHLEGQGYMRATTEKPAVEKTNSEIDMIKLQKSLTDLQKSVEALKWQRPRSESKARDNSKDQTEPRKRKCFNCGSENHLQNTCPVKSEKKGTVSKQEENHQARYVASASGGLYADCQINNISMECLIDTGATLSIMSLKAWDIIRDSCSNELKAFSTPIYTASGNQIEVKGLIPVVVRLCGLNCVTEVLVADVDVDVILGLDFLSTNKCKLDIENYLLRIQNKSCKLNLVGKLGCYRVTVSEKVVIPARSETIIQGTVNMPIMRQKELGLIEPTDKPLGKGNSLVAKALVSTRDKVPLRIINLDDDRHDIFPGAHVANLSFVEKVQPVRVQTQNLPCSKHIPDHMKDLYKRSIQGLTPEQSKEVAELLLKHEASFSESDSDLGRTGITKHSIPTGNAHPIKQPVRRLPVQMNEEISQQIDDMLQKDVVQPSSSPWASGIVMVQKKDGTKRFCVDYRKLNDVTTKDAYPLPRIDDSLDQLAGAKWFSCLDLNSGYWQVEVADEDREKTAFASRRGLYEFKVMPFGLCNAPATFERLMETVLAGLNWKICLIYLDDIIVIGKTFENMVQNLDLVLNKLKEANLKLKPRKCNLFAKEVEFLGHIISEAGVKTDPKKTEVVVTWPNPENVHQVRAFVGFCSYYRRFIEGFAGIAKPLHKLTEKNQPFHWSEECEDAFEALKKKMIDAPVLAHH